MASVQFNEWLWASLPVDVGNEAFGTWVRCVIRAAQLEYPGYVIHESMVLRLGTRAVLKKLTTPVPAEGLTMVSLLELVPDSEPTPYAGRWYWPANWQVCSTFRPAWVAKRTRQRIPDELRDQVFDRDDYRCVRCGTDTDLTLDHIHPHSKGGADTFDNLQTLCASCNSKKRARVE